MSAKTIAGIIEFLADEVAVATGHQPYKMEIRRSPQSIYDLIFIISAESVHSKEDLHRTANKLKHLSTAVENVHYSRGKIFVRFTDDCIYNTANTLDEQIGSMFGLSDYLADQRYLIDYCDPNASKALHVGHLRNIAIGRSIASMYKCCGASVMTQSVLGDIGRNVCEAMAGYLQSTHNAQPGHEKGDIFVGRLYANYVRSLGEEASVSEPDMPIARELTIRKDYAQELLDQWRSGDPMVRNIWRQVVNWVSSGQEKTLNRLKVKFDTIQLESDGYDQSAHWIQLALRKQVIKHSRDGALLFPTGREDYPHLLLTRNDGFPTEHMRAIPIWGKLQSGVPGLRACIHVMGSEWLPTTELREMLLRRLISCHLYDRYYKVIHGFVRIAGGKMKSSDGAAILIDDFMDNLVNDRKVIELHDRSGGELGREFLARLISIGQFLAIDTQDDIDISTHSITSNDNSPIMVMARFLAGRSNTETKPTDMNLVDLRFVVLQSIRFSGFLSRAHLSRDCTEFFRFLWRLAEWLNGIEQRTVAAYFGDKLIRAGLRVLDLCPNSREEELKL